MGFYSGIDYGSVAGLTNRIFSRLGMYVFNVLFWGGGEAYFIVSTHTEEEHNCAHYCPLPLLSLDAPVSFLGP